MRIVDQINYTKDVCLRCGDFIRRQNIPLYNFTWDLEHVLGDSSVIAPECLWLACKHQKPGVPLTASFPWGRTDFSAV